MNRASLGDPLAYVLIVNGGDVTASHNAVHARLALWISMSECCSRRALMTDCSLPILTGLGVCSMAVFAINLQQVGQHLFPPHAVCCLGTNELTYHTPHNTKTIRAREGFMPYYGEGTSLSITSTMLLLPVGVLGAASCSCRSYLNNWISGRISSTLCNAPGAEEDDAILPHVYRDEVPLS